MTTQPDAASTEARGEIAAGLRAALAHEPVVAALYRALVDEAMSETTELVALRALDAAVARHGRALLALPGVDEAEAVYHALAELAMARVIRTTVPYYGPEQIAAYQTAIRQYAADIAEAKATIVDLTRQRDLLAGAMAGFRHPFDASVEGEDDEEAIAHAPQDVATLLAEIDRLRAEVAAQRPVVAAAARYGAALAALRAEQDRLHSIGYTGLRADSPDFDRLSGEQYVALDVLDCIAVVLARATPDAEEKGDGR